MFCPNCGTVNEGQGQFCVKCGQSLASAPPVVSPSQGVTSGKAVASLICGVLFFIFPAAVAAVVLGHISLAEIRKSAGRLKGDGLAVTGLVLGYMGFLVIPIILIIAAIAIPNLLRARIAANEASAVGSLREINIAEVTYSSQYGNGFAPNLGTLDGAEGGVSSCDDAGLIPSSLAGGSKAGYVFHYVPLDESGAELNMENRSAAPARGCSQAGVPRFKVTADPINPGTTGMRSYYTDDSGVIRRSSDGQATADSPPLQ